MAVISPRAVISVAVRPSLWGAGMSAMWRLLPRDHRIRRGALPVDYLRFRQQTHQGGDGTTPISGHDLVAFLKWARSNRRVLR
jgi:hypothetical protein